MAFNFREDPSLDLSIPSGEYQNRAGSIQDNYEYLVNNLNAQKVFDRISKFLSEDEKSRLKKVESGGLAREIVQLVEKNVSGKIYIAFRDVLADLQPELYEKLIENTSYNDRVHFQSSSGDQGHESLARGDPDSPVEAPSSADSGLPSTCFSSLETEHLHETPGHQLSIRTSGAAYEPIELKKRKMAPLKNIAIPLLSSQGICDSELNTPVEDISYAYETEVDEQPVTTIDELKAAEKNSVKVLRLLDVEEGLVDCLCTCLMNQQAITSFHIDGPSLSPSSMDKIIERLSALYTIEKFSFTGIDFTEDSLEKHFIQCLNGNIQLSKLVLDQCSFSEKAWIPIEIAIRNMERLDTLSINDTGMGDNGAAHICSGLSKNDSMTQLRLARNKITDRGVIHVADCIQNKLHLKYLSLASNQITDEGSEHLAKIKQLNRQPCTVNLADNQIGQSGAWAILRHWTTTSEQKHSFKFDRNQITSIGNSENVVSLVGNVYGKRRVDILVKRISRGESFPIVNLRGMSLKDKDIETLCLLLSTDGKLEKIDLGKNSLTDESLASLTLLFHSCKRLSCINFDGNQISDGSINEIFAKNLPDIRKHHQQVPFYLNSKFWEIVKGTSNRLLNLNQVNLCKYSIPILSKIIDGEPLRKIFVTNCPLSYSDITRLCKLAFGYPMVTDTLVFTKNNFGPEEVAALAEGFPKETKLFNIGKRISPVIKENALTKIVVSENGVTPNGLKSMTETVFRCKNLTHVNLAKNSIGDMGCKHLNKYLTDDPPLVSLCLDGNAIGFTGLSAMYKSLGKNTHMKHLSLADSHITSVCSRLIADVLERNTHLEYLDLSNNALGDDTKAFTLFCQSLQRNQSLETLKIRDNYVDVEGMSCLAYNLKRNRSLQKIDISKNNMQKAGWEAMLDVLQLGIIRYIDFSDYFRLNANIEITCNTLASGNVALSYLGLRNTLVTHEYAERIATAIGCGCRATTREKSTETVLDLSGNEIDKNTQKKLTRIRITYGSPRCIFNNIDAAQDYFGSPFRDVP